MPKNPEGGMPGMPRDRGQVARSEVKTGSYNIDFNNPEKVEAHIDGIIDQKITESGRKISPQTKERWKRYFYKSVDRALRTLQTNTTENNDIEEKRIGESEQREVRIEKIGSLKSYIEQALKRVNPDMPNKEELRDQVFIEAAKTLKKGEKIITIAYDLDNFKIFNDRRGHVAGDKVLESFGGALGSSVEESIIDSLQEALRPEDTGAHFSGDEFGALLVVPAQVNDEEIVRRIVRTTQQHTERPSLAINAGEGEMETQEISTGYEIISYEEIKNLLDSQEGLKKLFDTKLKEADSRSLFSKVLRYVKEVRNQSVESADRVIGPQAKIEISEEEMKFARALHSNMRSLSELYPEYAVNSRNQLLEYASLTLLLPKFGEDNPERFMDCINRIRQLIEEFANKKT